MTERVTIGGLSALMQRPGTETGPPMLFVHGYFGQAMAFEPMMNWFAGHGHLCYSVDLRGRCLSSPDCDLGRVSVHDYADDVCRVAHEVGRPIILGHSMGGLVAQLAASLECAQAIVLLASAPPRGISVMSLKLAIAQLGYMPSILLSRPVRPGRRDLRDLVFNRVPAAEREIGLDLMVPDSGRAGREMSLLGVPVDRAKVRVPVLVISGDSDLFIPLSRARRIAERYDAPIRVAPGRGHMLIIEPGFEEICEWIETWLPAGAESPAALASA